MDLEANQTEGIDDDHYTSGMLTLEPGVNEEFSPDVQPCLEMMSNVSLTEGEYCNATWDTLHCWPPTLSGTTAKEFCANIFTDVPHLINYPDAYAFRDCGPNGQWLWDGWTNYSQCLQVIDPKLQSGGSPDVVEAVGYITFIGALLSLSTLMVTLFIFTYFRALECDRLRVHRNLVVSLIIRFVVMLVLTEPFVSHREQITYRDVDWLCKTLLGVRMYAQMSSINWMFVEGLYLHSRLTSNIFNNGAPFALYYTIGWGAPLLFIPVWAMTMYMYHPVHCWKGYGSLHYVWILVAPMVIALLINFLFLINIIRIMVTRLRPAALQQRHQVPSSPSSICDPQLKKNPNSFPLLKIPASRNTSFCKKKSFRLPRLQRDGKQGEKTSVERFTSYKTLVLETPETTSQRDHVRFYQNYRDSEEDFQSQDVFSLEEREQDRGHPGGYHLHPSNVSVGEEVILRDGSCLSHKYTGDMQLRDSLYSVQETKSKSMPLQQSDIRVDIGHDAHKTACRSRSSPSMLLRNIYRSKFRRSSNYPLMKIQNQSFTKQAQMPLCVSRSSCGFRRKEDGCLVPPSVFEDDDSYKSASHRDYSSLNNVTYRNSGHFSSHQHKKGNRQSSLSTASNRPEFNIRKAIKATLILFPLLGITNLLFAINPRDKGRLEGAYMITNALLQTSQGILVSVLYCFLNTEVQAYLKKRWRRYRLQRLKFSARYNSGRNARSTVVLSPTTLSLTRSQCATSQTYCMSPGSVSQAV